jgi:hypothetical protein
MPEISQFPQHWLKYLKQAGAVPDLNIHQIWEDVPDLVFHGESLLPCSGHSPAFDPIIVGSVDGVFGLPY